MNNKISCKEIIISVSNAIIDWGDITYGDPATDLASMLMITNNYDTLKNAMEI